jgi:hypothetical protein
MRKVDLQRLKEVESISRVTETRLLMLIFWWLKAREEEAAAALAISDISAAVESEDREEELMTARSERNKEWKAQERACWFRLGTHVPGAPPSPLSLQLAHTAGDWGRKR